VRALADEPKSAGSYEVIWDGKDDKGKEVASGIYFHQLKAGDFTETKKMLLLK
jgi:flagellar hook assembly protein FlgD